MPLLVRFFIVMPTVSPLMIATFLATVAVAAIVLAADPSRGTAAVMPILALQLFAAASGFSTPARRGHFDLLLTSGTQRLVIVLAHWLVSVAPGLMAWMLVGLVEAAMSGWTHVAAFASGTCAALAVVSTVPWALSARLPRFAPSIGWLLVLVTLASVAPSGQIEAWVAGAANGSATVTAVVVFLLYPAVVVGRELRPADWLVVAPGLVAAMAAMAGACGWLARTDFPLEAAQ